jgi:drug/metabolite transporter (DMT)-like permease
MLRRISELTLAKFCGIYSGIIFGIYWIPLRQLDASGFHGMWATSIFNLVATVLILPAIIFSWRRFFPGRVRFHIICFGTGLGYALYASAFVYTDVISVIVLFYLMPIWGFVFARIVIGDPITPIRWLSMCVALIGLWVILGQGATLPLPHNLGDWMALVAGFLWAAISLMLLTDSKESPLSYAAGFITWGCIISLVCAWLSTQFGFEQAPAWQNLGAELKWLVPFSLIIILPAAVATVYGPTKLNPGVVGLLFMTEISVGTITAALWAEEQFGLSQALGVILITLAGILETAWIFLKGRPLEQTS